MLLKILVFAKCQFKGANMCTFVNFLAPKLVCLYLYNFLAKRAKRMLSKWSIFVKEGSLDLGHCTLLQTNSVVVNVIPSKKSTDIILSLIAIDLIFTIKV